MGFAIPINDVRPIIEQLITYGRVSPPFSVFIIVGNYPEMAEWYNLGCRCIYRRFADGPVAQPGCKRRYYYRC